MQHGNTSLSASILIQSAALHYTLTEPSQVEISLYNMLGRKFSIINRLQPSGSYSLSLKNRTLPAGVYFLHFKAGLVEKRMKIVLPGG